MEKNTFYHALQIDEDKCIGCSHCMKICPTEAIRVCNGKARIFENRCIDCGKCYKVCFSKAIYLKQDDFDSIFDYKCRVALVPAVFLGQFPTDIRPSRIYAVLYELGFNHVFEIESAVSIYAYLKNLYARDHTDDYPLISAFCPAIVRLIQVKFPSLVNNIIPVKPPVDITAMYARKLLEEQGCNPDDIGLFYITPCAAKIAAVKSPVGEEKSIINGVINMDVLYNRVYKKIKEQGKNYIAPQFSKARLSSDAILSSLTNGERRLCMAKRSLSIDEIDNVIEFLEKVENDEIEGIEFLELRACDQSCAGGVLVCENRFLVSECMYARARKVAERERNGETTRDLEINKERDYLAKNSMVESIKPRSMMVLDKDISKALEKMERIREIKNMLPQTDCCFCGAPTCDALAEDIVRDNAQLTDCIFIQRSLEAVDNMKISEAIDITKKIWGNEKLNISNDE